MSIRLGQASISENGTIWGQPGRQNPDELRTSPWILIKDNPWNYVFRAKDPAVREKIAKNCEDSIANFAIGYSQNNGAAPRTTMWDEASKCGWDFSKIKTPCNTDCSAGSGAWIRGAGVVYNGLRDMYTGNAKAAIQATKAFDTFTDDNHTKSASLLMRGDVLLRRNSGHSGHMAIVLDSSVVEDFDDYAFVHDCYACHIRSGPGTEFDSLTTVPGNTVVGKYSTADNGWVQINYAGAVGYCSPKYVTAMPRMIVTGCSSCHIRKDAGVLHASVGTVSGNSYVHWFGEQKNVLGTTWYKIYYNGIIGWSSGKYVKFL